MIFFIIGVSGSGKTTVGQLLADEINMPFIDADDHHPESNIEKMSEGIPLNDDDREPWLNTIHGIAVEHSRSGCVIACSALKEVYRKRLSRNIESKVSWVYLKGSYDLIFERLNARAGHFMEPKMLRSQFDALEEPQESIEADIENSPEEIISIIKSKIEMKAEIGVVGLGVMGKSLSRNLAGRGFRTALYNRHVEGKEENVAAEFKSAYQELDTAYAHDDLAAFVQSLAMPRKIILMVNAGAAVDAVLADLMLVLDEGDIIVDGGNSHYEDTNARMDLLKEKGLFFIGSGISGGEEGALKGPSIMPSGDTDAYSKVQKYLETIAAKDEEQKPCCTYVGQQGSGHFVKMIHNGIEYAEMQLLGECYSVLKKQGRSNEEIASVFEEWMKDLSSYLLGITVDILRKKEGDEYLLDLILDKAANKGTGKWATAAIANSGEPATMIPAALFARYLSFFKERRTETALVFSTNDGGEDISIQELKEAYQFGRIINHHQGFSVIAQVSDQNDWNVDLSEIARIWTAGCIIKSDFMKELVVCLRKDSSILLNDKMSQLIRKTHSSIKSVVRKCLSNETHIPCLMESVNFFHGVKTANLSANLIQAQRDYFGAHTYKRKDDPSGKSYHSEWSS